MAVLVLPSVSHAAETPPNRERREAIVETTLEYVRANYVYPERVAAVERALRENIRAGRYDTFAGLDDFLDALNGDMEAAANDKHLRVINNPRMAAQLRQEAAGTGEVSPQFLAMLKGSNFRLRKAESLDGNVGYFKFDNFVEPRFARGAFVGAMNMLHASAAFILDLSDNGGGASEAADLLLSYFLPEGTRIGESWDRVTNKTTVSTVTPSPDVKPLLDIPVYVLVSERTASAAEAVAYSLQQAKRAVVVGTRTKGMANAGQHFLIDDRFFVMVPTVLNRNSVSGTNWEGVGVIPDIVVPRGKAREAAMAHALRRLAEGEPVKTEKERLTFMADGYAAAVSAEPVPHGLLEACVGQYDGGQAVVRQDGLYFVSGDAIRRMTYLGDQTFAVDGRPDFRLRFQADDGKTTRLDVLWYDETSDSHPRIK
jgi:hypothetical protein